MAELAPLDPVTQEIPDKLYFRIGEVSKLTGVKQYAALQVAHDPGQVWVLGAAVALLAGLLCMLLLRRERVFARTGPAPDDGGTVLTVASLTRGSGETDQNTYSPDARDRARVEFLHPGQIAIDRELFVQMRVAHDQQRNEQRDEKTERETKHGRGL